MSSVRTSGLRLVGLALAATAAAACQPLPPAGSAGDADAQRGLAFAKTSCGGCHAIEQRSVSPNPNAPPFARIVNQEGLTANTLSVWLRNAHNYPDQMKFTLENRNVDELVDYMLTLRDPNFRPEI